MDHDERAGTGRERLTGLRLGGSLQTSSLRRKKVAAGALAVVSLYTAQAVLAPPGVAADPSSKPSRPAFERCAWERLADARLGLHAWVQRCDYGFRRIDFVVKDDALAIRYSDGGAPEPVVDVIGLQPGETPAAAMRRIFRTGADPRLAPRCVLARYRNPAAGRPPAGVARYTFVPDRVYGRELKAKQRPDEVPDPPCGDFGDAADGVRYFEVHSNSRAAGRILFVRAGQDVPLFDEQTLRLTAAR